MLHRRSLNLRHNSETYERNLRVLQAVEKPLEVKKKIAIMLRDFIFGLKKTTQQEVLNIVPYRH